MIAPFVNRLPDDTFWAAKLVMAFTDEDIRAIVSTGQYSDPAAAAWLAECLIERRNRIGRAYLGRVLPLDNFRVENGQLAFDDLEATVWPDLAAHVHGGVVHARQRARDSCRRSRAPAAPRSVARCRWPVRGGAPLGRGAREDDHGVSADPRADRWSLWGSIAIGPGKSWRRQGNRCDAGPADTPQLDAKQKALFEQYTAEYNKRTGRTYTPQEGFDALSLSQQTTFDAVTHALMRSELTDEAGRSLGSPIDLLEGIDRIAGQYAGRDGDQQFRLYVRLKPDARDVLEKSREFFRDHENTVYHVGYPHSYRQTGKEPNMQFSLSEDGLPGGHRRRLPVQPVAAGAVQRPPDVRELRRSRRRESAPAQRPVERVHRLVAGRLRPS